MTMPQDLFAVRNSTATLHPNFVALRDSPFHGPARALMNDLYARMGDPNGGFVGAFQTGAFHARLFELACFAYLDSAGLAISRAFERPDFVCSKGPHAVSVEATTANPSGGGGPDLSVLLMDPIPDEKLAAKVRHEFPRRISTLLRRKLSGRYHELPHCAGRPFVLFVAPFFEPGSVYYTDEGLVGCLYGHDGTPDPFFGAAGAENISAVAYCNQFTVPRFFRLATGSRLVGLRTGMAYEDHTTDDFVIAEYRHELGSEVVPKETWGQGVTLFNNPWAANPLPPEVLPSTSTFLMRDEGLYREVSAFHPVTSFMMVSVPDPAQSSSGSSSGESE